MNTYYEELLRDVFDDVEGISLEKMSKLSSESIPFFNHLKSRIDSGDPAAKAEASQIATNIKGYLERRLKELAEESGFDPEVYLANNPLDPEQKAMVAEMEKAISNLDNSKKVKNKKLKPIIVS